MKALIVDGLNLVRRVHAGIPDNPDAENNHDRIGGVIRSCCGSLKRALNRHEPTHCMVVFEGHSPTWRHKIHPDYKKNRPAMPADLSKGMESIKAAFSAMGVGSFELEGCEADDVIATIATKISSRNGRAVILSNDRIHCQLFQDNVRVFDHFSEQYLDENTVKKKYMVSHELIPDVLALAGDGGQSIPGIESVGIKTAAKLIDEYGDLESVLAARERIPGKLGEKIRNGAESAKTGFQLFSLKTDVELGINLSQFRYPAMSP